MNHVTITLDDLARLEHLRNAGRLACDAAALRDCCTPPEPADSEQLASLLFLITGQLDDVVTRCRDGWMNGEVNA